MRGEPAAPLFADTHKVLQFLDGTRRPDSIFCIFKVISCRTLFESRCYLLQWPPIRAEIHLFIFRFLSIHFDRAQLWGIPITGAFKLHPSFTLPKTANMWVDSAGT